MSSNHELGWYRVLLKLYPRSYRQDYEEEMLDTLTSMFNEVHSHTEKRQLVVRVLRDYCSSLVRQNLYATESSFDEAPAYVKRQFLASFVLVLPFAVILVYNFLNLSIRHVVPLLSFENHTWVIYSIILPIIGLIITIKTCFGGIYHQLVHGKWLEAVHVIMHDWLFLGGLIAMIAFVAIF